MGVAPPILSPGGGTHFPAPRKRSTLSETSFPAPLCSRGESPRKRHSARMPLRDFCTWRRTAFSCPTHQQPNVRSARREITLAPRCGLPLLRSGLVFAGANALDDHVGGDGVLTALEASGLDLWGTELVVLSACETGVGQVRNGEGVYGLRRALAVAGARTQLVSLWRVGDEPGPSQTHLCRAAQKRRRSVAGHGRFLAPPGPERGDGARRSRSAGPAPECPPVSRGRRGPYRGRGLPDSLRCPKPARSRGRPVADRSAGKGAARGDRG